MKALNPPVSSCSERSRSRWSMRSSQLSMCPYRIGRVGRDTDPVRLAVHREPLVGRAFLGADARADRLGEDFGSSARNRFHARLLEQQQSVAGSEARLTDHVRELDRRERLDRRLRHDAFDLPDQVGVIIKVVARMHAPDDMHFGRAAVAVCLDLGEYFPLVVIPSLGRAGRPAIRAETAVEHADVRRLDMKIPVIIYFFAAFAFLDAHASSPSRASGACSASASARPA